MHAIPVLYAVVIAGFVITPTLLTASSNKNLQQLQQSQNAYANSIGTGSGGPNTNNLKLESVNFSSRGQILVHLPQRIRDILLKPYPWQLGDTNQRFGAIGTIVAYAVLLLFIRYAWISRGQVFARAGPVLYPLIFLLIAYSLAAGNAGTGFRYRTHLVTLAIAAVAILREQALLVRAERRARAQKSIGPDGGMPAEALPTPA
jgi:mannitol-specific phosphotransferase system IIBC component